MGKPRIILLIRHAQSEGNKNREIHQVIPDHRVKLTDDGWSQAEEAGRRLRTLLKPDDTLQFFTSPYRRTRETTEGILRTLTSPAENGAPSPFSRHSIKVYEEPRIREQDFGNFQPCSQEMERMWRERADYGHFFYRIPNGESAADAYDRISGFNESLWRQFGEPDFPSVCVLVTHGLMSRVFLMKWYHWSVEYFEDLRNVNHCEFIVMEKNPDNGKYLLRSQLRTWSDLQIQRLEEAAKSQEPSVRPLQDSHRRNTLSQFLPTRPKATPSPPRTKWGGCVGGCNHNHDQYPRRSQQNQAQDVALPPPADTSLNENEESNANEHDDNPLPITSQTDGSSDPSSFTLSMPTKPQLPFRSTPAYLLSGRDGGGTDGTPTPHENVVHSIDYFAEEAPSDRRVSLDSKRRPHRQTTTEDLERWANESGMGKGVKADALGDEPSDSEDGDALDDLDEMRTREESVRESVY